MSMNLILLHEILGLAVQAFFLALLPQAFLQFFKPFLSAKLRPQNRLNSSKVSKIWFVHLKVVRGPTTLRSLVTSSFWNSFPFLMVLAPNKWSLVKLLAEYDTEG